MLEFIAFWDNCLVSVLEFIEELMKLNHSRDRKWRRLISSNTASWDTLTVVKNLVGFIWQACTFQKLLSNTALHVTYQGDTHVSLCGTCCKKWEFLFDGKPCSSPGPIDAAYDSLMLVNNNRPSVLPVFWHGSISGYCSNHLSGPVRVAMVIKNCSDFPTDSIHVSSQVTITGRIIIQEVPPSQQWYGATRKYIS